MVASPTLYDEAHIVVFSGDLDIYRVPEVRKALERARDKERVIIDMSEVHTLSAAVLTEFVRCYKHRSRKQWEPARLVVTSRQVRRIFEITELAKLWPFFGSLEEATATVSP